MRRQRNMVQMREQNKTPEKVLNKTETSSLLDAKFKTIFIRMINELSEDFSQTEGSCQITGEGRGREKTPRQD